MTAHRQPVVHLRDHLPSPRHDPADAQANHLAFASALAAIERLGGGTLQLPPGEWLLRAPDRERDRHALQLTRPGTRLRGAGLRATRLRLLPDPPGVLLGILAPGVAVERMTLVGTIDDPHEELFSGVVCQRYPTLTSFSDVVLEDMMGYGLFLNTRSYIDGGFNDISLDNLTIVRSGGDGIDFKLIDDRGRAPNRRIPVRAHGPRAFLHHVSVEGHSAHMPDKAGENGVDVRGQVSIQGLEVNDIRPGKPGTAARGAGAGAGGVNFRDEQTNLGDRKASHHGAGAAGSTLDSWYFSTLPNAEDEAKARGLRYRDFYEPHLGIGVGVTRGIRPRDVRARPARRRRAPAQATAPRPTATSRIKVAGGRNLTWGTFGDPAGRPLLWCHGGLLSHRDAEVIHEAARRHGFQVMAPDRPGVGGSDRARERSTADWAADVARLLDRTNVGRCAVLGWSMGGQYALALAALLGDRVTATAVVAGCPPLDDRAAWKALPARDRALTLAARRAPDAARAAVLALREAVRRQPSLVARSLALGAPPGERPAWRANAEILTGAMADGLARSHGAVDEYRVWAEPWGFDPGTIATPVTLWQGDEDPIVPMALARHLPGVVPAATPHLLPGRGHLLLATDGDAVLADLQQLAGRTG